MTDILSNDCASMEYSHGDFGDLNFRYEKT